MDILETVEDKQPVESDPKIAELKTSLFKLIKPEKNPWREEYKTELVECYDFKELKQWGGADMEKLSSLNVPAIPVDRINRGLETIRGIRDNTANKKKFSKQSTGDERIADIFDTLAEWVIRNGNFDEEKGEAFDALLDCGMGVRKFGYDPQGMGGVGEFWCEYVPTENLYWAKCKSKTLRDARWIVQHSVMDWEDAILLGPDKAAEIKSLKQTLASEYEKKKSGNQETSVNISNGDYSVNSPSVGSGTITYPDQVDVYEFWIERRTPKKKINYIDTQKDPAGNIVSVQPAVRVEAIDYQPDAQNGEQLIASFVERFYEQYVIVGNESGGILVAPPAQETQHPYVGMCAEVTKKGKPVGYIKKVLPHQKRINIAWAQKVAYNNSAIKSPIVTSGGNAPDYQTLAQQTSFGTMLHLPPGCRIESFNQQPQVNLQAIEEGSLARQDMDFAGAATEGSLRGQVSSGTSGIAMAQQQNASITPLNKWVNAEKASEIESGRLLLNLLVKNWGTKPELIARVVGEQEFAKLSGPQIDPITQQMTAPPLQWPAQIDIAQYDVVVEDQSTSDFRKQQTFNAIMALRGDGVLFTDEAMIRNAPVKDVESLIADNEKARQDVLRMLMQQNAMLQAQVGQMEKMIPKDPAKQNQAANASKGKSAPQTRQTMPGGTSPQTVLGAQ